MFRRGTIVLLAIMMVWTVSDLFTSPTPESRDFNSAFVIIYIGLIALCLMRSPWGFVGTIALALFRGVTELPIFTPIPEQGLLFGLAWSGAIWGVILYVTRLVLQIALTYFGYRGYSALQHLVLD